MRRSVVLLVTVLVFAAAAKTVATREANAQAPAAQEGAAAQAHQVPQQESTPQGIAGKNLNVTTGAPPAAEVNRADQPAAPKRAQGRAGREKMRSQFLPESWAPSGVDEAAPPVFPGTSCAVEEVLERAGARVSEFVANVGQWGATERVEHIRVDKQGRPGRPQARAFRYLVSIREVRPGMLAVEETRNRGASLAEFPTPLAATGLPAMAVVLHPYYRSDFEMVCEGLAEQRGRPAWQIRFRQRHDRPSRVRTYRVAGGTYALKIKGRAWVASDTYQLLRLETDLAAPVPEIRLKRDFLAIDYRPVEFPKKGLTFWLPERADVYMDFRGRRLHHRHSFSDFVLFTVDVNQQIYDPALPDPPP